MSSIYSQMRCRIQHEEDGVDNVGMSRAAWDRFRDYNATWRN